MKATGITRKVDDLGRIVLPKEIREQLDIADRTPIEIFTEDDKIILKKYSPACIFCGDATDMIMYREKLICKKCLSAMNAAAK